MGIARHALVGIALLSLGACAGRMQIRAVIPVPPELPVRAFPEIVVLVDGLQEEHGIADAIASHLQATASSSRVVRSDEDRLARMRAQGALGPAAIVLRVQTRVLETVRPSWITRPETVCGPWGCSTQQRTVLVDVPVIDAIAIVRVSEARSDRVLQELPLREHDERGDSMGMRFRALTRLRERAIAALDPGRVVLSIELEPVDDPGVAAALEAIRAGHPAEARRALEQIATRADFAARSAEDRARITFDLGQARRLEARAAEGLGEAEREARLAEAERTIRDAIRLRPRPSYALALAQIEEERQARARMRALEEAASHNFALAAGGTVAASVTVGGEAVPDPPPAYERAAPAP